MKNVLKINHTNRTIVMDRTFAKYAENTMSEEYSHLQQVRRDYPTYTVIQRRIKHNSGKKTYNGLTYEECSENQPHEPHYCYGQDFCQIC